MNIYDILLTLHIIQQAPGEAEAELAWLNSTNVFDAIITSDGDALVFGATAVIRP